MILRTSSARHLNNHLNRPLIPHPPQGDDHADGKEYPCNDTSNTEEDHFIFDIIDSAGLFGHVQVIDQRLQAFLVYEISKITEGVGHDKKENGSTGNDGNFDPFHAGQEGDGEEEDVSRESDENGDQ